MEVEGDCYGDRVLNIDYVKEDLLAVNYEYYSPKVPQYRGKLIAKSWA